MISEAFKPSKHGSIYSGMPTDSAINLHELQLRKARENSIYAFQ